MVASLRVASLFPFSLSSKNIEQDSSRIFCLPMRTFPSVAAVVRTLRLRFLSCFPSRLIASSFEMELRFGETRSCSNQRGGSTRSLPNCIDRFIISHRFVPPSTDVDGRRRPSEISVRSTKRGMGNSFRVDCRLFVITAVLS